MQMASDRLRQSTLLANSPKNSFLVAPRLDGTLLQRLWSASRCDITPACPSSRWYATMTWSYEKSLRGSTLNPAPAFADMSDELLALAVQRKDPGAELALDRRWRGRIEAFARKFVRNRSEAEEVAQVALWRIYLSSDKYDVGRPFEPWVFTIARNVAISAMRQRKHEMVQGEDELATMKPNAAAHPSRGLVMSEALTALQRCMDGLGERSRTVVALYKCNFSLADMGRVLNRPKTTVQSWMDAALEQLQSCMRANGFGEGSSLGTEHAAQA